MTKKRNAQTKQWLAQHVNDPYVKQAQRQGFRSRAAYKLLELQEKHRFIKRGMVVLDLGAAPGSWSQVARECVGPAGKVIAVDCLAMDSIPDVTFLQGDFTHDATRAWLLEQLGINRQSAAHVILSDMSPNLSGIWDADQARALDLAEQVWWFAQTHLLTGGTMLIKVFQGTGIDQFTKELKRHFQKVILHKPKASRPQSREFYLLALNFAGATSLPGSHTVS